MNDKSFVEDIKLKKLYRELDRSRIITNEYKNSIYPHLTFKVNSVSEYMEIVNILSRSSYESDVNGEILYRGMANEDWKLEPSLARYEKLDDDVEYNMVNSFLTMAPEAFLNLKSDFEILSKMQHYGLPTRLLDFTTNPLIALYFACSDLVGKKNARIVCHRAFVKITDDPLIEAVCGLYKAWTQDDLHIEDLGINNYNYLHRLYRISSDKLLIARPSYWNERIKRQSAIFMIFPNKLYDNYACWAYGGKKAYIHIWEQEGYEPILKKVKKEPLNQIYKKAAERDFQVTHDSIMELFDFYEKKGRLNELKDWNDQFRKRFGFYYNLECIDSETMKKDFCSIIVDKKVKHGILQQLRMLGIDEAFVYPELEHTAKKIKDFYMTNKQRRY